MSGQQTLLKLIETSYNSTDGEDKFFEKLDEIYENNCIGKNEAICQKINSLLDAIIKKNEEKFKGKNIRNPYRIEAATKIQAQFRGHKARKEAKEKARREAEKEKREPRNTAEEKRIDLMEIECIDKFKRKEIDINQTYNEFINYIQNANELFNLPEVDKSLKFFGDKGLNEQNKVKNIKTELEERVNEIKDEINIENTPFKYNNLVKSKFPKNKEEFNSEKYKQIKNVQEYIFNHKYFKDFHRIANLFDSDSSTGGNRVSILNNIQKEGDSPESKTYFMSVEAEEKINIDESNLDNDLKDAFKQFNKFLEEYIVGDDYKEIQLWKFDFKEGGFDKLNKNTIEGLVNSGKGKIEDTLMYQVDDGKFLKLFKEYLHPSTQLVEGNILKRFSSLSGNSELIKIFLERCIFFNDKIYGYSTNHENFKKLMVFKNIFRTIIGDPDPDSDPEKPLTNLEAVLNKNYKTNMNEYFKDEEYDFIDTVGFKKTEGDNAIKFIEALLIWLNTGIYKFEGDENTGKKDIGGNMENLIKNINLEILGLAGVMVKFWDKNTEIDESYANQIMREGSDDNTLITKSGGNYGPFKAVFGNKMSNIHVYQKLVNDFSLYSNLQSGKNFSFYAFGFSGSGKTYTLIEGSKFRGDVQINDFSVLQYIYTVLSNNNEADKAREALTKLCAQESGKELHEKSKLILDKSQPKNYIGIPKDWGNDTNTKGGWEGINIDAISLPSEDLTADDIEVSWYYPKKDNYPEKFEDKWEEVEDEIGDGKKIKISKFVKIVKKGEDDDKRTYSDYIKSNLGEKNIQGFCKYIENEMKKKLYIVPTSNNPNSSRAFTIYKIKTKLNGNPGGELRFVDMPGNEKTDQIKRDFIFGNDYGEHIKHIELKKKAGEELIPINAKETEEETIGSHPKCATLFRGYLRFSNEFDEEMSKDTNKKYKDGNFEIEDNHDSLLRFMETHLSYSGKIWEQPIPVSSYNTPIGPDIYSYKNGEGLHPEFNERLGEKLSDDIAKNLDKEKNKGIIKIEEGIYDYYNYNPEDKEKIYKIGRRMALSNYLTIKYKMMWNTGSPNTETGIYETGLSACENKLPFKCKGVIPEGKYKDQPLTHIVTKPKLNAFLEKNFVDFILFYNNNVDMDIEAEETMEYGGDFSKTDTVDNKGIDNVKSVNNGLSSKSSDEAKDSVAPAADPPPIPPKDSQKSAEMLRAKKIFSSMKEWIMPDTVGRTEGGDPDYTTIIGGLSNSDKDKPRFDDGIAPKVVQLKAIKRKCEDEEEEEEKKQECIETAKYELKPPFNRTNIQQAFPEKQYVSPERLNNNTEKCSKIYVIPEVDELETVLHQFLIAYVDLINKKNTSKPSPEQIKHDWIEEGELKFILKEMYYYEDELYDVDYDPLIKRHKEHYSKDNNLRKEIYDFLKKMIPTYINYTSGNIKTPITENEENFLFPSPLLIVLFEILLMFEACKGLDDVARISFQLCYCFITLNYILEQGHEINKCLENHRFVFLKKLLDGTEEDIERDKIVSNYLDFDGDPKECSKNDLSKVEKTESSEFKYIIDTDNISGANNIQKTIKETKNLPWFKNQCFYLKTGEFLEKIQRTYLEHFQSILYSDKLYKPDKPEGEPSGEDEDKGKDRFVTLAAILRVSNRGENYKKITNSKTPGGQQQLNRIKFADETLKFADLISGNIKDSTAVEGGFITNINLKKLLKLNKTSGYSLSFKNKNSKKKKLIKSRSRSMKRKDKRKRTKVRKRIPRN